MSVRPRGDTNLPPGEGRLWTFAPELNQIEAIRGSLARDSVRDIHVRSDGVWITVEGGVVVMDPQTFVFDPFTAAQGITARQLVGIAAAGKRLLTLGEAGTLFELRPDGRSWKRLDPPAPSINPREPVRWRHTAGSADWLLALGESGAEMTFRQLDAPQWGQLREETLAVIPRAEPPIWNQVVGDQGGGFWLGSDAGLHLLVTETGSMEHRIAPIQVTIPGGWGRSFGPHYGPSVGLQAEIITRQTDDVRRRMRDRVRLARIAKELRIPLDPVTPTTRLPGAVRALARDGAFLWVATADPLASDRSRVLLLHAASRKWLGWFSVSRPVTALVADASHLYLGLDVESVPGAIPVLRLAKAPYVTVPEIRRVADRILPEELGPKLAALPKKERAVHAFFAGDARTVVDLLANSPHPDAETLFLLAFAHDALGLDQPTRYEAYLDALATGFPESPLALAVSSLRPPRGASPHPAPVAVAAPATVANVAEPLTPIPAPPAPDSAAGILGRRDLNKDGKLNLIEFRLWRGPKAEVKPYDLNGDGLLDLKEIEAILREK